MKPHICIDSNSLTYFIDAMFPEYEPGNSALDLERIAMIRIYFYGGYCYHLVPAVKLEYKRIRDDKRYNIHKQVDNILSLDLPKNIDIQKINNRVKQLLLYHKKDRDCLILAEAEVGGMKILLTYDRDFINRLGSKAKALSIKKPTQFFGSLNIKPGSNTIYSPHPSNPLYYKKWWRI